MCAKKVKPFRLPRHIYNALEAVVGKRWISEKRAVVETYSKLSIEAASFLRKHQKDHTAIPACVVLPANTEEVRKVVKICNRYKVPFIPFTNGQVFCSTTVPKPTVVIHLSRMNRILQIDTENMCATVEAYVDYTQLQAEAMKRGLWNGGCPLATSLCKLSSQFAFAGLWQTDLKYGQLNRNIVSVKMVLPDGEILETGSRCLPGAGDFWEYGPGPDLTGLQRSAAGTSGIVTEITLKLHPWAGEKSLPEVPHGRPSLQDVHDPRYDAAVPPKNHRLYWIEFDDFESEIKAMREISHSGIAIGLNATGVYSAYYCSQTQELTEKRCKERFFPAWNCYVIIAGITSPKQIDYEEKVLKEIIKKVGGRFLSEDYKRDVLYALSPWNLDWVRHVCGYRMNRRMYANAWLPVGPFEVAIQTQRFWKDALETIGECHITDRGGAEDTPFIYALHRGRFCFAEVDNYPDPTNPDEIKKAVAFSIYGITRLVKEKVGNTLMAFIAVEPMTTMFPEVGPKAYLLFRKIRKVFDPNGVCSPQRQVYTDEEWKQMPQDIFDIVNKMRVFQGMKPIKKEEI